VADVAGYVAGQALRGPRLSPLSPGKTWSGAAGAVLAGVAALALLGETSWWAALAVMAGAVVGDLLESAVKRECGVKDAAGWLPGFGGLLDRVDSLLVALVVAGALA
jgi:phosphatidate cytidylyltransferase